MDYLNLHNHSIREGFKMFDKKNPHIYEIFKQEVDKAIAGGEPIISSKKIISTIRSWINVQTDGANFKIDDAFVPHFPRKLVDLQPEYRTYFKFRKLRSEVGGCYMEILDNGQYYFLPDEEYL